MVCFTRRRRSIGGSGSDDPADAQPGKGDFREAVDVDDEIGAIELLERRNAFFARVQPGVNVIFDDGHLMARGQFQHAAARCERHRGAGGIVKIGREDDELDAISSERRFERIEVDAQFGCWVRREFLSAPRGTRARAPWKIATAPG